MSKTQVKAVAAGIQPKQHLVEVTMTNGSKMQILTTWGKEGGSLRLDVDPHNHPAWQEKGQVVNVNNERINKFNQKFGGFSTLNKAKTEENK